MQRRVLQRALSCLLFLGTFFAIAHFLRQQSAPYFSDQTSIKLDHLRRHPDAYDTLFVGSSRVLRGFHPPTFDAECARLGHPVRSFNLGIGGLEGHEADYVLRQLSSIPGLELRHLLIEPLPFRAHLLNEQNFNSERAIAWHTPRQAWRTLRQSLREDGLVTRASLVEKHAGLLLQRLSAYGLGQTFVDYFSGLHEERIELAHAQWLQEQGYSIQEGVMAVQNRRFERRPVRYYKDQLRNMVAANAKRETVDELDLAYKRAQMTYLQAQLLAPVVVLLPTVRPSVQAVAAQSAGIFPNLWKYNRPLVHPELYAPEMRHDDDHLNRDGAELFSKLLAQRFAKALDRRARR